MLAIINGKIVTPTEIIENKVLLIDKDRIIEFADNYDETITTIDAKGRYVTPGFIDTHADKIEQFIIPRPTSQMDFELALKECERELLHQGITTMYHSLSLFKNEFFGVLPLRTKESVLKLAELIDSIHSRYHLIHHRLHLRIEIDNLEAFDIATEMINSAKVHQISFMDHTPGQGQYKNLDIYKKTISSYRGKEIESLGFEGVLDYHNTKETLSFEQLKKLTELAHQKNIAVASHDDDSIEKLKINQELGVDISEFPINIETARAAKERGFYTVVGSPNILLGGSHSGNMSAADAIKNDCADILCSDYYPAAILHSIFMMHRKHGVSLCEMVNKATLNPAKAMKISQDYGSLEVGKKADILIIDILDSYPVITHCLVEGNIAAHVEYRRSI